MEKRICKGCGVEFETDHPTKIFHTNLCRIAHWSKHQHDKKDM